MGNNPEKTIKKQDSKLKAIFAAVSFLLAFAGQYFLHSRKAVLPGVIFFIAAAACLAAAEAAGKSGKTEKKPEPARQMPLKKEIIFFALIIITAGFFRFYQIDTLPAGAHRDEAKAALDALSLSKGLQPMSAGSRIPVYISGITDNPAAYNYIMAVFYKFCPYGITPGRAASAFLGVLAVAAMYFLARGMLGVNFAVIAGFMLAISRWHFTFSRHILHAGFLVFVMILALYFCAKAYSKKKLFYFLAAGFCCGFTLYTFQAGRAFIPVILACLLFMYLKDRDFFRKNSEAMSYGAALLAITIVPVVMYMASDPQTFTRASYLFIFSPDNIGRFDGPAGILAGYFTALYKAFLMFNMKGSMNFLYNFAHYPMFDFVTGAFFALGFFYSIYRAVIGSKTHAILVIMLFLFLHGTVLFIDCPHATRAIMALPVAVLIAAAAAEKAAALLAAAGRGAAGRAVFSAAVILLAAAAADNYDVYFEKFKKNYMSWKEFSADSRQAGKYLRKLGPGINPVLDVKYVVPYENYAFDLETAGMINTPRENFNPEKHIIRKELQPGKNVFLLGPDSSIAAKNLAAAYPGGLYDTVYEQYNPDTPSFFVFMAEAGEAVIKPENPEPGLTAVYCPRPRGAGKTLYRVDTGIGFHWETKAPVSAPFTVVWRGRLEVGIRGDYVFYFRTRGGIEAKIDGNTLFFGAPQGSGAAEGKARLAAGSRKIEIINTVNVLPAEAVLEYSGPDTGGEIITVPEDKLSH